MRELITRLIDSQRAWNRERAWYRVFHEYLSSVHMIHKETGICLYSHEYESSEESDSAPYECFKRRMTDRFIERLGLVGDHLIQCFCMESCLIANIDRIICRDDSEDKTDQKKVIIYTIFQSDSREESYDESRVDRRHITWSEHAFQWPFSFDSLNDSFYEYRYEKGDEGDSEEMDMKVGVEWFHHIREDGLWSFTL